MWVIPSGPVGRFGQNTAYEMNLINGLLELATMEDVEAKAQARGDAADHVHPWRLKDSVRDSSLLVSL